MGSLRGRLLLSAVTALLVAAPSAQAAYGPNNDPFTEATPLVTNAGPDGGQSDLLNATSEPGEPAHGGTGTIRSVWWTWTAPRSGVAEVQTCGYGQATPLLGVYTGFDIAELTAVGSTAPSMCRASEKGRSQRFAAVAGTVYRIAVASDRTDNIFADYVSTVVRLSPSGDGFANAEPLPAAPAPIPTWAKRYPTVLGLATAEPGEPPVAGTTTSLAHSIWYAYTPARDQRVRIMACRIWDIDVTADAAIDVFAGTDLAALSPLTTTPDPRACDNSYNSGSVTALFRAGVDYRVRITQPGDTVAPIDLTFAAGPWDDDFAMASKLTDGSIDFDLTSHEAGEPAHGGRDTGHSRWQTVQPAHDTVYDLRACSDADLHATVYTGTRVNALLPVAVTTLPCPNGKGNHVRFRALAGTRYAIAIDGAAGAHGYLDVTTGPPNDDRDQAMLLQTRSDLGLATTEPGEPAHAGVVGGHSVWYRWVAPRDGTAQVSVCTAAFDVVAALYPVDPAAPSLGAADDVLGCGGTSASDRGARFTAPVERGHTYLLAVDGKAGATGQVESPVVAMIGPANDDLADAEPISPLTPSASSFGAVALGEATAQAGEPAHGGRAAEHSGWWRFKAPRAGLITVSTCNSNLAVADADTSIGVYKGTTVASLVPVTGADDGCGIYGGPKNAQVTFYANAGVTYRIAIDVHGSTQQTPITLTLPPTNDRFADAIDATNPSVGRGTLTGATFEPGEPLHGGERGGRSLWWTWTAPRTEPVVIVACGTIDTLLGVYTGTTVDALTAVAPSTPSSLCGYGRAQDVRFTAVAGTTYRIAVDGKHSAYGAVMFLVLTPAAADRFAAADDLGTTPSTRGLDLTLASAEPGEPAHAGRPAAHSAWLRIRPQTPVAVDLVACPSTSTAIQPRLAVYTGAAVDALTPVSADDGHGDCAGDDPGAHVRFQAAAGVEYAIAVDADDPGTVTLTSTIRPANDDLAGAAPLDTTPGTQVTASLGAATREPDEPAEVDAPSYPARGSVWYRIRVTTPQTVSLSACSAGTSSSTVTRQLQAFTGATVAGLTSLPDAVIAPCAPGQARAGRLTFPAQPGTDVLVALTGSAAADAVGQTLRVDGVPPNDAFADARTIPPDGGTLTTMDIVRATAEPGERRHASVPATHSVWWTYTPATDRHVTFTACASGAKVALSVYTGDVLDALTPIGAGIADAGDPCPATDLDLRAGVTYRIVADSAATDPGSVTLAVTNPTAPASGEFAAAVDLPIPGTVNTIMSQSTPEPGEPTHAGVGIGDSRWYRVTPVRDAVLDVSACAGPASADAVVAVYTGASVDALTEVAADDDDPRATCGSSAYDARVRFAAHAGVTYRIAVDLVAHWSSIVTLDVDERPAHDAFDDPAALTPATPQTVSNAAASAEAGEPAHDGGAAVRSAWLEWTAATDGRAVLHACSELYPVDRRVAVYTGTRVDALTAVAGRSGWDMCLDVPFDAVAGERYRVAVDAANPALDTTVELHLPPSNDDRAAAAELPAAGGSATVDLTAAGREPGEPQHAGTPGLASAWYRITAATTRDVEVSSCTTPFDAVLAVYEQAGSTLTAVAQGDDATGCGTVGLDPIVRWHAVAGHTYLVALAAAAGTVGPARIDVRDATAPAPRTRLTAPSPGRTANADVSIAFAADTPDATFECRTEDETAWSACSSPVVRHEPADGVHLVAVRAVAGGVADSTSALATYTTDRTGPTVTIASPAADSTSRAGAFHYTAVCGTAEGDVSQVEVRIWPGNAATGTPAVDRYVSCGEQRSPLLTAGSYTIVASQLDDLGNRTDTEPRHFTIVGDPAPTVQITTPMAGTTYLKSSVTGRVDGPGSGPVTVHYHRSGAAVSDPDAYTDSVDVRVGDVNTFTSYPQLADGQYVATAEWRTITGVVGRSDPVSFTIDTRGPALGFRSRPRYVMATSLRLDGQGDPGVDVHLTFTPSGGASLSRTVAVGAGGTWTTTFDDLAEGEYTVDGLSTDAAGNRATVHTGFAVDVRPPAPTLTAPADGATFPEGDVLFSGTLSSIPGDENTGGLAVTAAGGGQGLSRMLFSRGEERIWSDHEQLPAGTYTVRVRQEDGAGHVGESAPRTFTVGTPPTPTTPAEPTTPTDPATPTEPTEPTEPTSPTEPTTSTDPTTPTEPRTPTPTPTPTATKPKQPATTVAKAAPKLPPVAPATLADRLLPGTGGIPVKTGDALGNAVYVLPGRQLRVTRAGDLTIAAAICPFGCKVALSAAVTPDGAPRGAAPIRTPRLTVTGGPAGHRAAVRIGTTLRRRIARARGAQARLTITMTDVLGRSRRVATVVRLLPR